MPSASDILENLTTIANEWQGLAVAWHLFVGALLCALFIGWRPSTRVMGVLLAAPLFSVSALAWVSGNPFNGAMFGALWLTLSTIAVRQPVGAVQISSRPLLIAGVPLVAFGWAYPHFVAADSWFTYLYASPLGLLPCPTLSTVIGISLILNFFGSRSWALVMGAASVAYGLIGAFGLGVAIDLVLLKGAVLTGAAAIRYASSKGSRHIIALSSRPPAAAG